MKYKIKPYGTKSWTIEKGIWPFLYCLKNKNSFEWDFKFTIYKWEEYEYLYRTPEQAKEHLKTSIIFQGVKKANEKQSEKKKKEHNKNKTIIVPPWK